MPYACISRLRTFSGTYVIKQGLWSRLLKRSSTFVRSCLVLDPKDSSNITRQHSPKYCSRKGLTNPIKINCRSETCKTEAGLRAQEWIFQEKNFQKQPRNERHSGEDRGEQQGTAGSCCLQLRIKSDVPGDADTTTQVHARDSR